MKKQEAFKRFRRYKKIKQPIRGRGVFNLWVADTDQKKALGLSNLNILPKKHGMLFVYNHDVDNAFSMKETHIPLTIIFLNKDFEIIDVFKCKPLDRKPVISSEKYRYVIEI
jgi:uncharacterized protein